MRFTDFQNQRPIRFEGNFSKLLSALEKLHSNDADLRAALYQLDWEEPLHIVSRFKLDNQDQAMVELAHPLSVLIRMQNRRLLDAALVQDMLPEKETYYNESNLMRWSYGREGMWAHALSEAFSCADWRSAEKIKLWSGPRIGEKFVFANLYQGPLGRLCSLSRQTPAEDYSKVVDLGLQWGSEAAEGPNYGYATEETPQQAQERSQASLDELLCLAAQAVNPTLCQVLIDKGAQRSRRLLYQTANKGLFDLFWESLDIMRARPELSAKPKLKSKPGIEDESESEESLLYMVAESMAQGTRGAFESLSSRRSESYEMECFLKHKDRSLDFLIHAFSDGLALPGQQPLAVAQDNKAALAAITPALGRLGSPELVSLLDRQFPTPSPQELGALLNSDQTERFKSRALIAKSQHGAQWSSKNSAELAPLMVSWLNLISNGRSSDKKEKAQRVDEALNLLAWVEVQAPEIIPRGYTGALILSSSSIDSTAYSVALERAILNSVAAPGARKGPGPRKA